MIFETLKGQDLISVLKEDYTLRGINKINLREYSHRLWSYEDIRDARVFEFPLDEFSRGSVKQQKTKSTDLIGLTSLVTLNNGQKAQIPQLELDKKIKNPLEFLDIIEEVASYFPGRQDVYLVKTEGGYHFHGTEVCYQNWEKFIQNVQGKKTLIDKRFLEKMAERGYTNLRLISGKHKSDTPQLLGRISQN